MRFLVASCVVLLGACGSADVTNGGGDGGGGNGDGGTSGVDSPLEAVDVQRGLFGDWNVFSDGDQACTAHVTADAIDVDCGSSISMVEPSCTETREGHIIGTWHDVMDVRMEDQFTYTGTCTAAYTAHNEVILNMAANRTMASALTGVWPDSAGQWTYTARETDAAVTEDFLTCTATFTPATDANSIEIACQTRWIMDTSTTCEERLILDMSGSFTGAMLTVQFGGETQRQGSGCTQPSSEPLDPFELTASKI